ncbi:hypothetical protein CHS0354_000265 [Potamilus streckersoni]|uniref:Uncharacterized protein n=1 Tax=Potamilus streckersoni TaxID=2493646 RepID=A0AAE0RYN7_9BIVA|nr:hypothetical protein CHS0354_000265 [Potamilus streckersoni]
MKRRKAFSLWFQLLVVLGMWTCLVKSQQYFMDDPARCNFLNPLDIQRDATITVNARSNTGGTPVVIACRLTFKSVDTDALISVEVRSFSINSCGIELNIVGDRTTDNYVYRCASRPPTIINLNSQTVTIETKITNSPDNSNYNFVLVLTPKRTTVNRSTESSQVATGLVIGIVGGILGLIAIVAVVGCCCFRKYRNSRAHNYHEKEAKAKLDENDISSYVGYTNESYKKAPSNGKLDGTPSSHRKLLLAPSDSSEDKSDLSNGNKNMNRALPLPDSSSRSPTTKKGLNFVEKREQNFSERPVDVDRPKNPMLNALRENKKFKETFKSTEDDAEKRARSFSSGSRSSLDKLGPAPSVPDSLQEDTLGQPKLPVVAILPKSQKNPKTAMIRRRPTSTSSEELGRLSKSAEDMDDPDIKVVRDDTPPSPTEVVPIQVKDPNKGKTNTQHTLKPDRGRSPNVRKKSQGMDVDSPQVGRDRIHSTDRVLNERDRVEKSDAYSSGRYNKRTNRSKSSSSSKGFGHRRNRSKSVEDPYRPNTPTFSIGSVEDLESLPPLKRSGSKQSLYSSRSSLYDRRGRRGRKNSYSESLASYAHDDIDMYRHSDRHGSTGTTDDFDGYERPLSRFDRMRMSKSAGELTYDMREQATQTLRETATQTGNEHSVIFEPKRRVKKKTKLSKVSSSGTQTATKKGGLKDGKSKTEKESEEKADLSSKKTTEAKPEQIIKNNEEAEPSKAEKKKKPITKPKPKPRKSQSAGVAVSMDNDAEEDQSGLGNADTLPSPPSIQQQQEQQQQQVVRGIASQPSGLYYGGPLPGVPPPSYPGQPGIPYQTMTQSIPMGYSSGLYPQSQLPNQRILPQTQSYNAPRQPRKSNWDLLCELTGTDGNKSDERETASMASSVFTSNPASVAYTGIYPGQHQPATAYTHPQFNQMHLPGYPPSQPAFYPVESSYNQMQHGYNQFQPIQTGGQNEKGRGQTPQSLGSNDSSSSAKSSSSGQGKESTASGEKPMQKMSSWEALKEVTDKQYRIAYGTPTNDGTKTESIV